MAKKICDECEKVFDGGPRAFLCPNCRKRRLREAAKARNLNKLGSDARTKKRTIYKKDTEQRQDAAGK